MTQIIEGSGNVFKDMGLDDAEELQTKAELTRQIYKLIKLRGLTQAAAGQLLGLKQPDVSILMRGQHSRFSTDRLIQLLTALGRDVDIVVKPATRTRSRGRVRVVAA
jgi:predicted XRE-type DNA-binding protein